MIFIQLVVWKVRHFFILFPKICSQLFQLLIVSIKRAATRVVISDIFTKIDSFIDLLYQLYDTVYENQLTLSIMRHLILDGLAS